ncbi:hypothetical protein V502_07234 [Pseudogymnoascus sp. VKM F-4520 (FW-2644)]|nr:hypothetical protein V502_07234 [Pseudogymnoascus sp. VKM F-4520 (FW-2644)]
MADATSHPPPKGDNPSPAASTSGSNAETKPDALDSVISPQKALPDHLDKPNAVEAVDVKFDKEKIFAEMMRLTEEVFNMDDETRKKTYILPSMPPPTSTDPEVAIRVLRELYDETDEEDEASNNDRDAKNVPPIGGNDYNEFDREETIARMRKTMDEVFNMDEETRKKTYPLPSMPRPKPVGPEVAFEFLRELYAEMDGKNEAEEAALARGQATPNNAERE